MSEIKLIQGDCLEEMDKLIEQGIIVDAIICDPPYGTTACRWDTVIPFEPMWERLNKLIKSNGAIVLFGSEPFSSALRMSNIKNYKYDWIWEKNIPTGFLNANRMPLRNHEIISVFYKKQPAYNPQKTKGVKSHNKGRGKHMISNIYGKAPVVDNTEDAGNMKYPKSVLYFNRIASSKTIHPTQKPVALMEYLIKTYTNENELVLDFTCGSGTTMVACKNLNRKGIGIELDDKYFQIAKERIENNKLI